MTNYTAVYESLFKQNLRRYASLRKQIKSRVNRVLAEPYANTEVLADASGKLNLLGCRSARLDRNFRLIFVICEECRTIQNVNIAFARIYLIKLWFFLQLALMIELTP